MSISMLNLDELVSIFNFLSAKDLGRVSQVCALWNEAANTSYLWKRHCLEKWSFCNLASVPGEKTWKTYFVRRLRLEESVETGRPGRDYSCKTLRGQSPPIKDVVYITSNEMYETSFTSDCLSPMIASCSNNVQIWNIREGKCVYKYEHNEGRRDPSGTNSSNDTTFKFLAFQQKQSWLASADNKGFVHVLDTKELKTVCLINTQTDISAITFGVNPFETKTGVDQKVLLYCLARGGHFQLWDIHSSESPVHELDCTSVLTGPEGIIEFNSTHLMALSSDIADRIDVFDLHSLQPNKYSYHVPSPNICTILQTRADSLKCLKWHPQKKHIIVSAFFYKGIMLWDTSKGGRKISSFTSNNILEITAMEIQGKYLLVCTSKAMLHLLDITNETNVELLKTFQDHIKPITGLFVDPFRVLTCSEDFSIRVYRWKKLSSDGSGISKTLESRYTLLGGSLQRAGKGFRKIICDLSTCVGLADNNSLKAYTFSF